MRAGERERSANSPLFPSDGKQGRQTLVTGVDSPPFSRVCQHDAPSVQPVYKKRNLPSRHLDGMSFSRGELPEYAAGRGGMEEEESENRGQPFCRFRAPRVHLESVQEAAAQHFAWRITAFPGYLEMLR